MLATPGGCLTGAICGVFIIFPISEARVLLIFPISEARVLLFAFWLYAIVFVGGFAGAFLTIVCASGKTWVGILGVGLIICGAGEFCGGVLGGKDEIGVGNGDALGTIGEGTGDGGVSLGDACDDQFF